MYKRKRGEVAWVIQQMLVKAGAMRQHQWEPNIWHQYEAVVKCYMIQSGQHVAADVSNNWECHRARLSWRTGVSHPSDARSQWFRTISWNCAPSPFGLQPWCTAATWSPLMHLVRQLIVSSGFLFNLGRGPTHPSIGCAFLRTPQRRLISACILREKCTATANSVDAFHISIYK